MKSAFKPRAKPRAKPCPQPAPPCALITPAPAPVPAVAPPPVVAPDLPPLPLVGERDKPLWPRTEDDIDLPTFSPPPPPFLDAPIYLGSVRAQLFHDHDPLDLEVRLAADGSTVEIGPILLDPVATRRLWRLLRIAVAVAVLGCGYPAPEARHG